MTRLMPLGVSLLDRFLSGYYFTACWLLSISGDFTTFLMTCLKPMPFLVFPRAPAGFLLIVYFKPLF
jgi:hypothetical protein